MTNTEKELRFVLTDEEFAKFRECVKRMANRVTKGSAVKELTVMYDNPNAALSFYTKSVDGRLRVRTSVPGHPLLFEEISTQPGSSMLTWKQRIPELRDHDVQQEREIEVRIDAAEMPQMIAILERVLHCPRISSYERLRETFYMDGVEVASDLFPYGHVVEIELKVGNDVGTLYKAADMLGLGNHAVSKLSCDDMYRYLCDQAGIEPRSDILFGDPAMPRYDHNINRIKHREE